MAGAIYVPLKTVFNDAGLRQAQKQISGVARSLKGVLGTLGVATSIGAVVSQLEQAAKAAVADTKAQALLAQQMRNTVGANNSQIASTEAFIQKLQLQTSILDDQLRPAMSSLVRATGDVAKAQDLLAVATNVSAATGKDLESVALALGKAHSGQTTALFRMIPGLKGSSDWLAKLKANTAGAAEAAANTDPFTKINVVFNDMQEAIGMALIPAMQELAKYVSGEEFQAGFKNAVGTFTDFINGLGAISDAIFVLDKQLDGFWESLSIPKIDLGWVEFIIKKISPLYNLVSQVISLGKSEAAKARLNAGSGVNTTTLEGILKASGSVKTYTAETLKNTGATKKLATENKALADAVNKAKEAFEAKVKAYQDAVRAGQDIIATTKSLTEKLSDLFGLTPKLGEFESQTVDAFRSVYDEINSAFSNNQILKSAADQLTAYVDGVSATWRKYAKEKDEFVAKEAAAKVLFESQMDAYNAAAKAANELFESEMDAYNAAVEAANKLFESQMDAYNAAVAAGQQLIASTKEMTASFVGLFKIAPQMGEFESKTVSAFENIFNTIKSALADKRILQNSADALRAYATSTMNSLKAIARQQDVLAGKINIARTITSGVMGLGQITNLLKTTTQSVTTSVRTIANGIETIVTKTADVTQTGGLIEGFQEVVNKTKAFAKNLIELKKLGLNKNLFAQLVNAGADAGGATAQAIVDGGSETIVALNDLYGQLDVAAADIAENTTDIMYEVGQQIISNGFIDGLVSQLDALTATAEAMANAFASAFNAQLAAAVQVALPSVPVAPVLPEKPVAPVLPEKPVLPTITPPIIPPGDIKDVTDKVTDKITEIIKDTLPTVPVPETPAAIMTRPDPNRSPQRYAAWLAGIGGIDPIRSPQRYAASQNTYNVTLNTGVVTNTAQVGSEIVAFIKSYERASGSVWQSA